MSLPSDFSQKSIKQSRAGVCDWKSLLTVGLKGDLEGRTVDEPNEDGRSSGQGGRILGRRDEAAGTKGFAHAATWPRNLNDDLYVGGTELASENAALALPLDVPGEGGEIRGDEAGLKAAQVGGDIR